MQVLIYNWWLLHISKWSLRPVLMMSPPLRWALELASLSARTRSISIWIPVKAARDCWPKSLWVCPFNCWMSFPGRSPVSRICTHLPTPNFIRQSFRTCASSLLHPGEGVKFHLHCINIQIRHQVRLVTNERFEMIKEKNSQRGCVANLGTSFLSNRSCRHIYFDVIAILQK